MELKEIKLIVDNLIYKVKELEFGKPVSMSDLMNSDEINKFDSTELLNIYDKFIAKCKKENIKLESNNINQLFEGLPYNLLFVKTFNQSIKYYTQNGELSKVEELTDDNLKNINGMLVKCILSDRSQEIGYGDPLKTKSPEEFDTVVSDYIYLWTWKNIDEKTNQLIGDSDEKYNQIYKKIWIKDINEVNAILNSNPRWGGKLTNNFFIEVI